jgi:predicted lipoprotein
MIRAGRRAFLSSVGAVSLAAMSGGCGRVSAREQALRGTLERVLLPDARAITEHSRALQARLSAAASPAMIAEARDAWRSAAVAWQRGAAFPHGPYVETKALLHASFWPIRSEAIAAMLASAEPIDAQRVAALGVNAKGMFALEYLLFEGESPGAPWLLGARRDRALASARAFAADVCAQAEMLKNALGDGQAFVRAFAGGGQTNLNRVVNELIRTVESAVVRIEHLLAAHAWRGFSARDVLGGPSGTSTEMLVTWLAVCERVYGAGSAASLAGLVHAVSPAIHTHATAAFAAALGGLTRLGQPLERAAQADPASLLAAKDTIRQLEVVLRSELASALGVTISFGSSDGD